MNTAMDDGRPESLGEQTLSFPSISDDDTFDAFTPSGDTKKNLKDTPRDPRRPRDTQDPRERRPGDAQDPRERRPGDAQDPRERRPGDAQERRERRLGEAEHVRELRRAGEPPQAREPQPGREPRPASQPQSGREPLPAREPQAGRESQPAREPQAGREPLPTREPQRSREPLPVREPRQGRERRQVGEPQQGREPQQAHEPLPRRRPTSPNRPAFPGHPATGAPEGHGAPGEVNLFGAPAKPADRVDFFTPRKPAAGTSPAPEDTPSADRPAPGPQDPAQPAPGAQSLFRSAPTRPARPAADATPGRPAAAPSGEPSLFARPAALNVPPTGEPSTATPSPTDDHLAPEHPYAPEQPTDAEQGTDAEQPTDADRQTDADQLSDVDQVGDAEQTLAAKPSADEPPAVEALPPATDPSADHDASSPEDLNPSEDPDTSTDLAPSAEPDLSTEPAPSGEDSSADAASTGDVDVSAGPDLDPSAEPDDSAPDLAPSTESRTADEPADDEESTSVPSTEAAPADDTLAETAFLQSEATTLDEGEDDGEDEDEDAEKAAEEEEEEDAAADEQPPADGTRTEALPPETVEALTTALDQLRESITDIRLGLDLPGVKDARQARTDLLAQLDNYVLPRVRTSTAPALIVVAGSTGAGKSTLVNSLAERNVSRTGIRRPTTGTPVLVCHPDDRQWFAEGELLGTVQRLDQPEPTATRGGGAGTGTNDGLVLVATEKLPQGVALLDTPDIDSVVEEHHEIAHRMLDAADLWIFVTTAARYADAPAWSLLKLAKERGARLAIVLSRVQPKAMDVVLKHFVRMLTEYGLGDIDRFVIHESEVTDGRLPDSEVTDLRLWLAELSVDEERRAQAVRETLNGVLDSFRTRVPALAKHLEAQVAFRAELRKDVEAAFFGALSDIDKAARSGSLLHGEVLARWQDFAGSGDLMRSLQLRRRGRAARQAPERVIAFRAAIRTGLESVIVAAANRATAEVVARWRHRAELGGKLGEGLDVPSDTLVRNAGRAIASWQDHLGELVRTEGVAKRSVSKIVSFDPDALALIFTVAMFSGANGEGVPHRLVNALLGAESLRGIGAKALSDLRARIGMLFDEEAMRYVQALDSAGVPDESAATRLYQATYNLEVAR
ncbi:dynamin family protein [Nonomuraea sp. AD125B]|uniref:dynamin family protein n=1 Tax=Nonomuraea sp. AD125B TaxID=3242897 RepID=UPI003527FBF6